MENYQQITRRTDLGVANSGVLRTIHAMNFTGCIIALITFFAIGLGFVWVIKLEYYVGAHVARWIGLLGGAMVAASALLEPFWVSSVIGIVGGTVVWGATELPDQEKRVAGGQFPNNPGKRFRNREK